MNKRAYAKICRKFVIPILSQPFHYAYVSSKQPFTYYFNLGDYLQHNSEATMLRVKIPINSKSIHIDSASAVTPWSYSFQLDKRRAVRWLRTPAQMLSYYLEEICGVDSRAFVSLLDYPLSIVLPLCKDIKTYVHTHYDDLGLAGRYFVDLDTISGIPPNSLRTKGDDPYAWLTLMGKTSYTPQWWTNRFFETFVDAIKISNPTLLTLKEFALARWLWVTEGASKFSKLYLGNDYVRTKFGAAVSLSDNEILGLVSHARMGSKDQDIGVFIKADEVSYKNRLIANVPLGGYIIAAYIRYLIESFCGNKPSFSKLMPTLDDKIELCELCSKGYQIVPLDESAYDYNVTRESWLGFISFLHQCFPQNDGVLAFEQYFNNARWIYDGQSDKWLKGMPSGLALTSLVNSWMNYIKQTTLLPGQLNWACGDDVLSIPYHPVTLEQIEQDYAKFGSQANASKNWISYRFGEYLRILYGEKGTTGYPARIWGTLLFAYDMSHRDPLTKLNENAALFKQFYDRAGLPFDEDFVARDLSWALYNQVPYFSKKMAKQWLHSPRVDGGFGKLPYNNLAFNWTFEEKQFKQYQYNRIRLPRVVENWGKVTLDITTTTKVTDAQVHLGKPYTLPPITNEQEWVARLNREDIPKFGPFSDLLLDPIPLPVVDFVSIANMSQIAQTFGYNVFPNLRGNWTSIHSRLILASLKLVELVNDILQQHNLLTLV